MAPADFLLATRLVCTKESTGLVATLCVRGAGASDWREPAAPAVVVPAVTSPKPSSPAADARSASLLVCRFDDARCQRDGFGWVM